MKKIMTITAVLILAVSLVSAPASAGSRHHRVAEGMLIGVGAAIIGSAIVHGFTNNYDRGPSFNHGSNYGNETGYGYGNPGWQNHRHNRSCGHEQVWVPPIQRQEWVQGHYNRRGRWIPGRYIQIVAKPGYWEERRICRW